MRKKILLAITGGIAAYKAADIISGLISNGYIVKVITTDNALKFITPTVIGAISNGQYITDNDPNKIMHIKLAQECDMFVCVPCTANTMTKFANGIADNFVSSTFLALPSSTPKVICPAMNTKMWENKITQENLFKLERNDSYISIINPVEGLLACGDTGIGKLPKPRTIVNKLHKMLDTSDNKWQWPLSLRPVGITTDSLSYQNINLTKDVELPIYPHVGSFGVKRKFDKHRGVDLYCPAGTAVTPVENGEVVIIRPWTGKNANCNWWNDTDAIGILGKSGLIYYAELTVNKFLKEGIKVIKGETLLGRVKTVLKKDKGRPMSMLHFELRDPGFYNNIDKNWSDILPKGLHDPTPYLKQSLNSFYLQKV
jgi:phosphopantothenoylcysteine decarboxylase